VGTNDSGLLWIHGLLIATGAATGLEGTPVEQQECLRLLVRRMFVLLDEELQILVLVYGIQRFFQLRQVGGLGFE
jgi:hypothetical protein